MEKMGITDPAGRGLGKKAVYLTLKVERIAPRSAALLKQEMLSQGGNAVLDERELDCSGKVTNALLMGSLEQFEGLVRTLTPFPALEPLRELLSETLENVYRTRYALRFGNRRVALGEKTLLMGVLNVTPDSFSDGGSFFDRDKAVDHGLRMVEEGADIVDIGGESTRPGSKPIDVDEELRRVLPVIRRLSRESDVPISIDTTKSAVALEAAQAGARMINDISGLRFDPSLARVAAREGIPLVLMHIRGTPETMQKDTQYDSLFSDILQSLRKSIRRAESSGVDPQQIVIDPGIGFGKTLEGNLLLIKNLSEFRVLGKPILLGTSRKSFLGKVLQAETGQRLEGTLSSVAIGVMKGAHIIRCHDVLQAKKAILVADAVRLAGERLEAKGERPGVQSSG